MTRLERYRPGNLLRALRNPDLVVQELRRVSSLLNTAYHRRYPHGGFPVMDADWDTLVILDGCRFDLFEPVHERFVESEPDYDLRSVTSMGSSSQEFIEGNFRGETYDDTVYVSANPFVGRYEDDTFHAVKNLFVTEWDDTLNTVRPSVVTEAGINAHEEHPHKRIIVHYMQPHYPFIGERGQEFEHRGLYPEDSVTTGRNKKTDPDVGDVPTRVWFRLRKGEIDVETAWELYRENLEVVVPHVRDLRAAISGKTVISSDHGNLMGERVWPVPIRGYGHPDYLHVQELLQVPWLVLPAVGDRRSVRADEPEQDMRKQSVNEETVEERLSHLGYRS